MQPFHDVVGIGVGRRFNGLYQYGIKEIDLELIDLSGTERPRHEESLGLRMSRGFVDGV